MNTRNNFVMKLYLDLILVGKNEAISSMSFGNPRNSAESPADGVEDIEPSSSNDKNETSVSSQASGKCVRIITCSTLALPKNHVFSVDYCKLPPHVHMQDRTLLV